MAVVAMELLVALVLVAMAFKVVAAVIALGVHGGCRGPRGRRGSGSNCGRLRGLVDVGVPVIAIFAMCLPQLIRDRLLICVLVLVLQTPWHSLVCSSV